MEPLTSPRYIADDGRGSLEVVRGGRRLIRASIRPRQNPAVVVGSKACTLPQPYPATCRQLPVGPHSSVVYYSEYFAWLLQSSQRSSLPPSFPYLDVTALLRRRLRKYVCFPGGATCSQSQRRIETTQPQSASLQSLGRYMWQPPDCINSLRTFQYSSQ